MHFDDGFNCLNQHFPRQNPESCSNLEALQAQAVPQEIWSDNGGSQDEEHCTPFVSIRDDGTASLASLPGC